MTGFKVAVILACHNRRAKTTACLDRLFRCKQPPLMSISVHLLDDASTDGTTEIVKSAHPSVHVIQGNGSLFWNQGMIRAWKSAEIEDPDFFLWLNDDTELNEDAIEVLWKTSLEYNHQAIVVGSTSTTPNGSIPSYGGRDKNGALLTPGPTPRPCHTFNGNCVLIPSVVHKKLGKLSHRYSHSFGDFDYGYRADHAEVIRVITPGFIGWCAPHDRAPKWSNPSTPFLTRIKSMYSPLGCPPQEQFHFDLVKSNFFVAFFHFFTIHLRVLMPQLWSHGEKYSDREAT